MSSGAAIVNVSFHFWSPIPFIYFTPSFVHIKNLLPFVANNVPPADNVTLFFSVACSAGFSVISVFFCVFSCKEEMIVLIFPSP